jgi:ABC-type transporter MlaC component
MRHTNQLFAARIFVLFVVGMSCSLFNSPSSTVLAQAPITDSMVRKPASKHEKRLQDAFNKRVKEYLTVRDRVKNQLPPLSKDATPEQIDAYQKRFVEGLRTARTYAKQGYIFSPETSNYFRQLIRTEFKGTDRSELRKTVLEAETGGVPMRVNYPYPETKELTEMPPTLLLKLPQLAKEVKYRFVKRNLLLVDTDNGLIVDYMTNALP